METTITNRFNNLKEKAAFVNKYILNGKIKTTKQELTGSTRNIEMENLLNKVSNALNSIEEKIMN